MRVTVTGAGGVLGRGLVARLLSEGHEVTGIARRRPESWPSAARFVTADIRDADAVRRAVSGATVVAHCVAARGTDDIQGAANLLAAMAENGSGRIVFTSCAQVYGAGSRPATEDGPLNPTSSVGRHTVRVAMTRQKQHFAPAKLTDLDICRSRAVRRIQGQRTADGQPFKLGKARTADNCVNRH